MQRFVRIVLLAMDGGKKVTVSEGLYDHALMYLTYTLIAHEDFLTQVHDVDQCEAPKAVVPPASGSASTEASSSDPKPNGP